ncbi:hypothetical protein [Dyella japonica]|uniref:Lipoprotein n=1 Tax=Dyella japonica TaxID=231455 RepID=A0ABV2K1D7_9GAMM
MPSFKANRLAMMLCMVVTATGCDRGGESGNHGVMDHRAKVPTASSANQGPVKLLSESGKTVYCFQFPKSTYVSIPQRATFLTVEFNQIEDITSGEHSDSPPVVGTGNYLIALHAYDNEAIRDIALTDIASYGKTEEMDGYQVTFYNSYNGGGRVNAISRSKLFSVSLYIISRAHRDATQRRDDATAVLKFIGNALTTCQGKGS